MDYRVITIGRQFGSGGHEIGERLSRKLGIPLYDKNLIEMAGERLGIDTKELKAVDETALTKILDTYRISESFQSVTGYGQPLTDSMFLTQSSLIEALARQGSCIFIGRCADWVLRGNPNCINVFVCASMKARVRRVMMRNFLTEKEAIEKIRRVDKKRKNYYETYTGRKWGSIDSHQLLLNISQLGMEQTVSVIENLYLNRY